MALAIGFDHRSILALIKTFIISSILFVVINSFHDFKFILSSLFWDRRRR